MQKDSSNTICGTVFHFSFQLFDKTHVFTVSRSGKRSNMFSIISVGRLLILSEVEALLRVIFFGGGHDDDDDDINISKDNNNNNIIRAFNEAT